MSNPHAVAAAEAFVGSPFRLRGRDPVTGLDCVGLIAAVTDRVGGNARPPTSYGLRNTNISAMLSSASASGLRRTENPSAGDVLLFDLGAGQFHLAVAVGPEAIVHAHAGLRKVVQGRPDPSWKRIAAWQIPTHFKD